MLQQRVLCDQHTASHANLEKTVLMMETVWKSNFNFLKGVCMVCVNFIVIVVLVKKYEALISYCKNQSRYRPGVAQRVPGS